MAAAERVVLYAPRFFGAQEDTSLEGEVVEHFVLYAP